MKAELKSLHSIDLPGGVPDSPPNPKSFWIVVQAEIGPIAEEVADVFTFYVTTPAKLAEILKVSPHQVGLHLLIVREFDWTVVEGALQRIVSQAEGETWEELATSIGRHGLWEFENYTVRSD